MRPHRGSHRATIRPRPPRTVAVRLGLAYGLVSVLVVTLMGVGIYLVTVRALRLRAEDDLSALAEFYAAYTAMAADEAQLAALAPQITSFFAPQAGYDVRLFSARNGALLAATHDIGVLPSLSALSVLGQRRPTLFLAASYDQPSRIYAARPVLAADGTLLAVVEVSRSIDQVQNLLAVLRLVLAAAGALTLILAVTASIFLARQMTRPLRQIEEATQAIAAGEFDRRLEVSSDDEIGRLAHSVNRMAGELARLEAARREFLARVSHDLRTPLTAIKGLAINLQDSAPEEMQASLSTIDEQTDRLIRLVNDLLTLSRLQAGELRLHRSQTNLTAVAHSASTTAREKARRLGVTLTEDLADTLPPIHADPDRLQQVVLNLLDNALKATPPGGSVVIRTLRAGSQVVLTVTDNGRGLTAEEAAHAFEPYFRGVGGGTGLGLSIAREIVAAHGGRIWLNARTEGGAQAGFSLPG